LNFSGKSRIAGIGASPVKPSPQAQVKQDERSFMAEIKAVGEELATLQSQHKPSRAHHTRTKSSGVNGVASFTGVDSLESRMSSLTAKYASLMASVSRNEALSKVHTQAQNLERLNRELNAENDALYGRFNDELARVLTSVRSGNIEDEWRKRVKEAEDDATKLRRENARLKRELAGYTAAGGGSPASPTKRM
jgi:hypothetical protein